LSITIFVCLWLSWFPIQIFNQYHDHCRNNFYFLICSHLCKIYLTTNSWVMDGQESCQLSLNYLLNGNHFKYIRYSCHCHCQNTFWLYFKKSSNVDHVMSIAIICGSHSVKLYFKFVVYWHIQLFLFNSWSYVAGTGKGWTKRCFISLKLALRQNMREPSTL